MSEEPEDLVLRACARTQRDVFVILGGEVALPARVLALHNGEVILAVSRGVIDRIHV